MNVALLRALRIVIAADSDPVRQVLFANLMQARRLVRVAYGLHSRVAGTWLSALVVSGYGVGYSVRLSSPPGRRLILAAAKHVNAGRQVDRICDWVGAHECHRIRIGFGIETTLRGLGRLAHAASNRGLWRAFRVIRRLDRQHGFLVACRSAAAIAWYERAKAMLSEHRPGAVLVSSDSNPEEVGLTAAAAALAVPRVFVSHAYPTPFSPPLNVELAILEGEAALRARCRRGALKGDVVLAGVEGDSAPLDLHGFDRKQPVIGIFAPKAIAWPTLAAIIEECRLVYAPRRIIIRWHPSRLDQRRHLQALSDLADIEESPMGAPLADVARRCDWVIADENSNVHLPVLKLGIPTVVVRGLGLYPESRSDMYGFAAARVVFPPVQSIRELRLADVKTFFDHDWVERFRQYDSAYLRPEADVRAEVRAAIRRVVESTPAGVTPQRRETPPSAGEAPLPVGGAR